MAAVPCLASIAQISIWAPRLLSVLRVLLPLQPPEASHCPGAAFDRPSTRPKNHYPAGTLLESSRGWSRVRCPEGIHPASAPIPRAGC
jgi:hypothetical protein